jgi:hypothetical protein
MGIAILRIWPRACDVGNGIVTGRRPVGGLTVAQETTIGNPGEVTSDRDCSHWNQMFLSF